MAVFNPEVPPTQDPNFLRYSKVVEAPPPMPVITDKSTGIALDTAAEGFSGAVSLVDTAIKKGISNEAYKQIDPMRDQFTAGLEKIKAGLDQGTIPAAVQGVSGSNTGSLFDANASMDDAELPAGLDSGLSRLTQLAEAKAAGSPRLNDTQYAKDSLSVAKQLRAQYPGYRDYIDSEVSKASGLPVANSYYENMLQDINRQLTQVGKAKDDIGTLMMRNLDVPMMDQYITKRKAGDPSVTDAMVLEKIAGWQNLQTMNKVDAAKRAESQDNIVTKQRDETASLTRSANQTVDLYMKDVANLSGMPGLGETMKYFQEVQAGMHPEASDQEIKQRVYQLQAYRQGIYQQLRQRAVDSDPIIGNDKSEAVLKTALTPLDTIITLANDKDASPAFYHMHQIEAIKNDDVHDWLVNKERGAISRQMIAGRAVMGEQYFPDWIKSIVQQGLDRPIQDAFGQEAMSAISPIVDKRGQPIPRTMKDAIQHGKSVGIPDESQYFGSVVGLVGKIADQNMPLQTKDQLIDWAFNSKNVGRLDELKMDYKDPRTGEEVPGKYRAFNMLSQPAITTAVAETAKVHPENYTKYQSTLEQEFGKLYKSDVQDLNKIMAKPYLNAHFSFNDRNNAFGLVDNNNRPILRNDRALGIENPNAVYLNGVLDTLDRVNKGIANLSYVHKMNPAGPGDTPQYLLQALQTIGFRPGSNINGATEGMTKAIIKTAAPEMTPDELNRKVFRGAPGTLQGNFSDYPPGAPVRVN